MMDFTVDIIQSVVDRLSDYIEVVTVESDKPSYPYLFLGSFTSYELKSKTNFRMYGTFQLSYRWKGFKSLVTPLNDVAVIKDRMLRYKGDVLFDEMVYLKQQQSTGLVQVLDADNVYSTVITYEYEIVAPMEYYDRVTFDGGLVEGLNCTKK